MECFSLTYCWKQTCAWAGVKSNSSPQALISEMHICVRSPASDSSVFNVLELSLLARKLLSTSIKDHKAQRKHDVRACVRVDKEVVDLLVCWSLTSWPPFWWEAQRSDRRTTECGVRPRRTGKYYFMCGSSFGGRPRTDDHDNNAVWLQSVEASRWSPGMPNLGSTVIQSLASHINNLASDAIDQFWNPPSTLADH